MVNQMRDKYTPVMGLEVHVQLLTNTKIFSSDANEFGLIPNTNISVITLGHPGTLPKLNKKVVEQAIKMGLACHCDISRENIFDRKNYFYPDLPKGYQITQDKTPICIGGYLSVKLKNGQEKKIRLNRIHLEEDAGKSIHVEGETDTLIDFNRAGVPLIEIVTEPDLRSSEEASALLSEIRKLVKYLEICDGNMEEASMRCDANVSVMLKDAKEYGKKVELKNMNSIRNVQRAIDTEIKRQISELEKGNAIISETRTFNPESGTTTGLRTKEELNDYRYFLEPDLSPVLVSDEMLSAIKAAMPTLPHAFYEKFIQTYQLPEYDAEFLSEHKETALYFDAVCKSTGHYKSASNWMMGPVKSYLNDASVTIPDFPLSPEIMADLINLVANGRVSFAAASQKLFPLLLENPKVSPMQLAQEKNLLQDSSADTIKPLIEEVISTFPDQVKLYKKGKKGLIGLFVGEVMKRSKGKANPKLANQLIKEVLG